MWQERFLLRIARSPPAPQNKSQWDLFFNSNTLVPHPTTSLTTTCPSSSSPQTAHFRLCRLLHSRLSFSSWSRFSTSDDVSTSPCFAWTRLRDRFELVIAAWVAAEGGGDSTCRIALATALAGNWLDTRGGRRSSSPYHPRIHFLGTDWIQDAPSGPSHYVRRFQWAIWK